MAALAPDWDSGYKVSVPDDSGGVTRGTYLSRYDDWQYSKLVVEKSEVEVRVSW